MALKANKCRYFVPKDSYTTRTPLPARVTLDLVHVHGQPSGLQECARAPTGCPVGSAPACSLALHGKLDAARGAYSWPLLSAADFFACALPRAFTANSDRPEAQWRVLA